MGTKNNKWGQKAGANDVRKMRITHFICKQNPLQHKILGHKINCPHYLSPLLSHANILKINKINTMGTKGHNYI